MKIFNRTVVTGNNGFAGELGHIPIVPGGEECHCGKQGCLETVASEWALELRVSKLLERQIKLQELLELSASGNNDVRCALEEMCQYLAIGIACVVNIFNPGRFYIYGKCFKSQPDLLDLLVKQTELRTLLPSFAACEFILAHGGELEGTIACVIDHLTDSLVPEI